MSEKYKSRIGKNLIKMVMFQMYGDSKLIYREYIQNSRDAINEAVKLGILDKVTAGRIVVTIDRENRKIEIRDNGTGISVNRAESLLLNIADSEKDGENSAGQFGIGRLVGGYFCKKLTFKTSYKGEDCASEIIFDIDKIKYVLDDDEDRREATEIIDDTTSKNIYDEDIQDHYFVVTLEDVNVDEYPELLDEDVIKDYLREVAPIDFSVPFKNQIVEPSITDEYKVLLSKIGWFQISVNDDSLYKKYGLSIEGTGDKILKLEYFKFQDPKYGLLAWGWYAITKFTKAIPTSDKKRCFRVRKHNIQIGNAELLDSFFKEPRGNKYFYGEIHVVNHKIKLNSARDNFAPTPEGEVLKVHLRNFCAELVKIYHLANTVKNSISKVLDDKTITDQKVKEEKINNVVQSFEDKKNSQSDVAKTIIKSYQDKAKEKISCSVVKEPEVNSKSTIKSEEKETIEPKTQPNPVDIYDGLEKLYTEKEINLIKRIFKILFEGTSSVKKFKELIEALQTFVINKLKNEKF